MSLSIALFSCKPYDQRFFNLENDMFNYIEHRLTPETVNIINPRRGKVVDTQAIIQALKSGQPGDLGLDAYAQEGDMFFRDLSEQIILDDQFQRP